MKIITIGGSGFIGTYLIELLQPEHQLLNIDKRNSTAFPHLTSIVDIRDYDHLLPAIQPADWAILLAAEHRDDVSPASLYYDVNVQGTKNVLKALDEKGIHKVIFISSVAVYGLNKLNPDENAPAAPFNHYGKSKWMAEEVLREWQQKDANNKTLIIVRPTVVFGPNNKGNVHNLLQQISSGKFLMIGSGNNRKSMSYIENITGFIRYLLQKNGSGYHVFNYTDKPDLSMNELVAIVEKAMNKKIAAVRIPYWLGYLGGVAFDIAAVITRKKFSISAVRVKKFCATTQFSGEQWRQTGFTPSYTLYEGLIKTIQAMQQES
ncbi:NAD-dependent epimerase/dehydratase family protein [Ilyomonas limi]|uniref:NAD-dependent epimerase/dehydratase family protein n=1 Tax=Ilyomonas limi TaxID=2575867 RepID=A0A4V5UWA4_9BACT|nr:NAD-dependent epimerase/dehydratase family protein [Ilyomonas limi]TKK68023.1 NAD-dependent epimerase/dehydratase family protein [Ilyomonas limi]